MADFLFYLAFATLVAHELDAVLKHEWRFLFVLRALPEATARRTFVLLHVPLVALLLWLVSHFSQTVQIVSQVGLDIFMIVHAGLHWRLEPVGSEVARVSHSRHLTDIPNAFPGLFKGFYYWIKPLGNPARGPEERRGWGSSFGARGGGQERTV